MSGPNRHATPLLSPILATRPRIPYPHGSQHLFSPAKVATRHRFLGTGPTGIISIIFPHVLLESKPPWNYWASPRGNHCFTYYSNTELRASFSVFTCMFFTHDPPDYGHRQTFVHEFRTSLLPVRADRVNYHAHGISITRLKRIFNTPVSGWGGNGIT